MKKDTTIKQVENINKGSLSKLEEMARQVNLDISNLQNVCSIIVDYLRETVSCSNKLQERENTKIEGSICVVLKELGSINEASRVLCENIENFGINKRRIGKNE